MSTELINLLAYVGVNPASRSPARAVQDFMARCRDNKDLANTFLQRVIKVGMSKPIDDPQLVLLFGSYIIEDIIKTGRTVLYDDLIAIKPLWDKAILLQTRSYNRALFDGSVVHTMDDDGNITVAAGEPKPSSTSKPKKKRVKGAGSAMARARQLFADNPKLNRKEMIALMVKTLEISEMTGSTYFAMFNKDAKRETGGKKKRKETTRQDQVKAVFSTRDTWADRKELVAAIVAEIGCSAASANTFSYAVMPSTKGRKT